MPGLTARRSCAMVAALALVACGGEEGGLCGEGLDPVVVTGLSGTLEGAPAVEVLLRVPDTCETVDRAWMFWDDAADAVSFGEEPSGVLRRGEVDVGEEDRRIFFRDVNVGVRLDYPGDVEAATVDFVWFANGMDLTAATCRDDDGALRCRAS